MPSQCACSLQGGERECRDMVRAGRRCADSAVNTKCGRVVCQMEASRAMSLVATEESVQVRSKRKLSTCLPGVGVPGTVP